MGKHTVRRQSTLEGARIEVLNCRRVESREKNSWASVRSRNMRPPGGSLPHIRLVLLLFRFNVRGEHGVRRVAVKFRVCLCFLNQLKPKGVRSLAFSSLVLCISCLIRPKYKKKNRWWEEFRVWLRQCISRYTFSKWSTRFWRPV